MVESERNKDNGCGVCDKSPLADSKEPNICGTLQNEIAQFWKKYGYYDVSYDQLVWAIGEHLKYKTIETIRVNNELIAFGRWNVVGDNADILDCVIRPDYRNKNLLRLMLLRGWRRFPYVKTINFERYLKDRKPRRIEMTRFLGVKDGK